MPLLLCAEDDPLIATFMRSILEPEGYALEVFGNGRSFLDRMNGPSADLFLLDLNLPDMTGLDILKRISETRMGTPAIMVTASDDLEPAVEAMQLGALDYVTKPYSSQRLLVSVRNALGRVEARREIAHLRSELAESQAPAGLVGNSPEMEEVRRMILKAASSEIPVLVLGETGTGKERVAQAIHAASPRKHKPFVEVNCAALAESLLESELFGHEKGAFTGADRRQAGQFEQANGGTLFLDEIGDMPLATQASILRALQEKRFRRVGGSQSVQVDVRVLCATHRPLEEHVKAGRFRQDLFYRINGLSLALPPLRGRKDDIQEFAEHFLQIYRRMEESPAQRFSNRALEALWHHAWPGNVRELEQAVRRAVVLCEEREIRPEHLPPALLGREIPSGNKPGGLLEEVEALERRMILEALERNAWVKARAASALGVTRRILAYKMLSLGIRQP